MRQYVWGTEALLYRSMARGTLTSEGR